jgi:hypothetical protein
VKALRQELALSESRVAAEAARAEELERQVRRERVCAT